MTHTAPMQAQISLLDNAYQKLSGLTLRTRGVVSGREEAWYNWMQAGFTLHDLELVIIWLKRRQREGKRDIGSMRFSTLIGNIDRFTEELSMAEAELRNCHPPPSAKEKVIQQARPTLSEPPATENTKTPGGLIPKLLDEMRKAVEKETKP